MSKLFDPITIRSIVFKNRLSLSPMCQYSCENLDGVPGDWHYQHYVSRAIGGFGLIIAEAAAVEPNGRITPRCTGIYNNEQVVAWQRINRDIKKYGCVPGIQIGHAGRKASTYEPFSPIQGQVPLEKGGWVPVGPSPVPFSDKDCTPTELTKEEIKAIVQKFADAAVRAHAAGFEFLEIHGAHGYLIQSFLSPAANKRTDDYGGSFENRIRFVVEVIKAIRAVWPSELPLAIRFSCTEWLEDGQGWTLDETIELAKIVKDLGVDIVDCSSGGGVPYAKIPYGPNFQVPFSEAVKKSGMTTMAVGAITEPEQAHKIIEEGKADFANIGRIALVDPYWPIKAARALGLGKTVQAPGQYQWPFRF